MSRNGVRIQLLVVVAVVTAVLGWLVSVVVTPDGTLLPSGGLISLYEPPTGPAVRVDGYGYAGYITSPNYDSLLAKLIVSGATFEEACARTGRALAEFRIAGVETNIGLLRALAANESVRKGEATTRFLKGIKEKRIRLEILTLGRDFATVNLEFKVRGRDVVGRQSQSWVRFPDLGWKVVSAHVSTMEGPRPW